MKSFQKITIFGKNSELDVLGMKTNHPLILYFTTFEVMKFIHTVKFSSEFFWTPTLHIPTSQQPDNRLK